MPSCPAYPRCPSSNHVTVTNTNGRGFTLDGTARFAEGSTRLVSTGNTERPGYTNGIGMGSIPGDGSYTGNGDDVIDVYGGAIDRDDTWSKLDVPYIVSFELIIAGTPTTPAVVTIEPGALLLFGNGRGITVGNEGAAGGLIAVGTADEPIVFTGPGAPDPGVWPGLRFNPDAVDAESIVDYVEIGFADYGVYMRDSSPTIDHTTIADSKLCAMQLLGESKPTVGEVLVTGSAPRFCE